MATAKKDPTEKVRVLAEQITSIDEQLTRLSGTMSEWLNKAKEASRETNLSTFFGGENTAFTMPTNLTYADYTDRLAAHLKAAETFGNEMVNAYIQQHAPSADTSALLTQRAEAATLYNNYRAVLADMMGVEIPALPDAPSVKVPSAKGGGSRAPKSVKFLFFRMKDGVKVYQSKYQHSLSSMASYHFGACGVAILRAQMQLQHGKVDETKPWEGDVTVEFGGETYKWHIGWETNPADADDTDVDDDTPEAAPEADAE